MKHDQYFLIGCEFSAEDVQPLISFLNNTAGQRVLIGLNSTGGKIGTAQFATHLLNENADRVSLCIVGCAYSSAFEVFRNFKGKRYITEGSMCMNHWAATSFAINTNGKPQSYEGEAFLAQAKKLASKEIGMAATYLKKSELKKLKAGHEVYFDQFRLLEMFPDIEVIKW